MGLMWAALWGYMRVELTAGQMAELNVGWRAVPRARRKLMAP